MTAWKSEVIADSSGKWCGNQMRFATKQEAEVYVYALALRWSSVSDYRVLECDGEANYKLVKGKPVAVASR